MLEKNLVFTDQAKAELLNSSFQNFYTVDNLSSLPKTSPQQHMSHFQITSSDILQAASKMKGKMISRTSEGIPSIFFKID